MQQFAVADDAAAEAGAQRDAEQVLIALRAAGLFQQVVDVGQKAGDRFAVDEQVAVVVDEHGDAEAVFEHRPQGHAAAKGRQVRHVVDDARRIVGRPGEGETDRHGRLRALGLHLREAADDVRQAAVELIGLAGDVDRIEKELIAADGGELEVRAAGVQRHDNAGVVRNVHQRVVFQG